MKSSDIIKKLKPVIVGMRRALHAIPEPAYEEHKTGEYILKTLAEAGLTGKVVGGTGIVAEIAGKRRGPTVAVRADMDALPLDERTGLSFSSTHTGHMHACGHDGHMAIVLGLALALSKMKNEFRGKVRFIFQPAEEKAPHGGAKFMTAEGVLRGVDFILGFHILPSIPAGTAAVLDGPVMAAADEFDITICGSGGHASMPENTTDTILIAAKVVEGLNNIVSRMISPFEPVVISCGEIHGGHAFNIIPDEVSIRGTVRTYSTRIREMMPDMIRQVVEGICKGFDAQYEMEYVNCYPPLVNDRKTAHFIREIAGKTLGKKNVVSMKPLMGSEDFSRYLEDKPGCYFFLGGGKKSGVNPSLHSSHYIFDEKALETGTLLLAEAVINSSLWKQ